MYYRINKAFSLLELMVVLLIIGCLAAIAYPSYQHILRRHYREIAKMRMLDVSAKLADYYIQHHSYAGASLEQLGASSDVEGRYKLTLAKLTAHQYVISAVPSGVQGGVDLVCGTMTLNHLAEKNSCW